VAGRSRLGEDRPVKKSEREAKNKLRNHENIAAADHVPVVTRKGTRMEYNVGQSVKQGFGSGIRDIIASRKKKG
jgi:hypothetical protein